MPPPLISLFVWVVVFVLTRKGFIDGRIARLPTVIVRPGPPNPAATGCFSSVPKAVLHVRIGNVGGLRRPKGANKRRGVPLRSTGS